MPAMTFAPLLTSNRLTFKIKMAATTGEAWIEHYVNELKGPGGLSEVGKQPLSYFDDIAGSYFEDERGFIDQVEAHQSNFILIPGPTRTVRMMHSVFAIDGGKLGQRTIGILGTRRSSPFKEISRSATFPLKAPKPRANQAPILIPSLTEFLACESAGDFQDLVGDDGGKDSFSLGMKPNSFWIHPKHSPRSGAPSPSGHPSSHSR